MLQVNENSPHRESIREVVSLFQSQFPAKWSGMRQEDWTNILGLWSQQSGPLYMRLATAIRVAIVASDIPTETRLPAERVLAQWLRISRSTVVTAYRFLEDAGYVTSKHGSGTWVRVLTPERSTTQRAAALNTLARSPVIDAFLAESSHLIDLATGAVAWPEGSSLADYAPDRAEMDAIGQEFGYLPQGYQPLRRAVANYFAQRGVPTTPEQIIITTGAQGALALITASFLQRGDALLIETPSFFGAIDAFRAAGVRLHPVTVTAGEGPLLERLSGRLRSGVVQWAYLMPTLQNPTGQSLTALGREQIVREAARAGVTLIEDLTMADLATDAPLPLSASAPEGDIIAIGSLSKSVWGGLRVGWIRASTARITRLARYKAVQDLGSSLISQMMATRILADLDALMATRRSELVTKRSMLEHALRDRFPTWRWHSPTAGLFLWVEIPGCETRELAQLATRHGVLVTPGPTLSVDEDHNHYLRLAYLRPLTEIHIGVERLTAAWEEYHHAGASRLALPTVIV